ncbi:MAG TPA: hypothetical protein DCG19_10160 [Cryomorphaceae bacterium]|nr:hypothetical protein [Owenweeksia sp.]MBG00067.1 hypothetical protein [Owenweeksia sp.]HAD97759.1 hypothetical protein [Cryomorphaceae bacterium]|tara:strand:+ start:589 stop:963 length:375 start_codon:yes stop_codon:yes gene_type:complete
MPVWKKILYYLIGVGLGIFMVSFLFGGRKIECSYFPNDRVLYDLRKKDRVVTDEVLAQLSGEGMDTSDISMLLTSGNVDFEKSKTKGDSCHIYWIDSDKEHKRPFSAEVRNCDSVATVLNINFQ